MLVIPRNKLSSHEKQSKEKAYSTRGRFSYRLKKEQFSYKIHLKRKGYVRLFFSIRREISSCRATRSVKAFRFCGGAGGGGGGSFEGSRSSFSGVLGEVSADRVSSSSKIPNFSIKNTSQTEKISKKSKSFASF